MVLPPDIFLFRRLLGCCRAGSAGGRRMATVSPSKGKLVPPGPFMQTLLLQGPHSLSRLYHHPLYLPDQRTSEGAGTFPSLLCLLQAAGISQARSTGCLQPCSSPLGRETSIERSQIPSSSPPTSRNKVKNSSGAGRSLHRGQDLSRQSQRPPGSTAGSVRLTGWSDHPLPLLEEASLEAVPGTEAVRLVP